MPQLQKGVIMRYTHIVPALFLDRPNRFVANILVDGQRSLCHVKNTGRCRELLIPGTEIFVKDFGEKTGRKTRYDLITVNRGGKLINVDSNAPNAVFAQWLKKGGLFEEIEVLRPETVYGQSRLDFYIEAEGRKTFAEVKGVTLEKNGVARFPDAPTERGIKHLRELTACVRDGYDAYVVFIIQMEGVQCFEPNWGTHRQFGEELRRAVDAGVNALALDCLVTEDSINANVPVTIIL